MASQGGKAEEVGPALVRPTKEMVFVSTHHHTTFSYLDGYGTPEDHARRAAELGMTHLALTEHGNVTSHVQHERACAKYDIEPIFGVELYTGGVAEGDRSRRKNHLTVLAEDQTGYKNLLTLVSRGWSEGFYHEPTVSGEMFAENYEGLVVLSGCSGSLLATSIVGGKNIALEDASYDRGRRVASWFHDLLGDNYYLEVQAFPELDKTSQINQALARMSEELGIPMVATLDAHYTKPEDSDMQMILHNTRPGKSQTIEQQAQSWGYDVPLTMHTDATIWKRLVGTGLTKRQAEQAIRNARTIAERCSGVRIPKVDNLRYPLPDGVPDAKWQFRQWIKEGWKYRRIGQRFRDLLPEYRARLRYEMELIESKGFIDYFLIISDICKYAKDNGVAVGPARGSAAASLVCYLLRITEVNPMLFPNLLFERFIDINRHDLPDIDLDFDDEKRYKIREYACEVYGAERVGNIGTFTKYKGKNSLDDVQKALYRDQWDVVEGVRVVKNLLIERMSGDLRADATIEDSIEMFPQVAAVFEKYPKLLQAARLEGNVKGMSVHAAGLVIANGPLTDFCAVYTKINRSTGLPLVDENGDVAEVVSLDKHDAEYLNAMKADILGLKTMAMIRICLEQIDMTLEELYETPLNDERTIQGFKDEDVIGVFQFDGQAMQNVNAGVKPDNFFEICDINALARPGPLHSGATGEYIDIKHGRRERKHWHPIIDDITLHTQGQIVYQEQILQIVRLLGGFSWEEAARIRKIISKKRGEQEFNRQRNKFIEGAAKHDMTEEQAHSVFSMLATAGAYAFNAAHCVSYGMLAYWTMWLKQHHPHEFYVAAMRKYTGKKDRKARRYEPKVHYLLRDAEAHGIEIGGIDIDTSGLSWSLDGDILRPGYSQIDGIAEKSGGAILAYLESVGGVDSIDDLINVRGIGPATLKAIKDFNESDDPFNLHSVSRKVVPVYEALMNGVSDGGVFELPRPTHKSEEVPYEKTDGNVPVTWVGILRDRNPKDLFEMHLSRTGNELKPADAKDPHLKDWVVMTGEDETGILNITIDRWRYPTLKRKVWDVDLDNDIVLFRGHKKGFQARRAIYVTEMWILETGDEDAARS